MKRVPNGRHTKEFRAEAVKLVAEGGRENIGSEKHGYMYIY